jgi:two-component system response regulator MtrA
MAAPLIAVVNHDPVFLRLMESVLQAESYEVLIIADGSTTYEVIKRDRPDLIVLDTWLQERHAGWDLIQVLKLDEATASIPILICSSDESESVRKKLTGKLNGIRVIHKPFDIRELLAAVKERLSLGRPGVVAGDGVNPDGHGS